MADQIILVHGTGAGTPSRPPRWWEPSSTFAIKLMQLLDPSYRLGEPFTWGGSVLESQRRSKAEALLSRLRSIEDEQGTYHLVAHSHGASVIWHTLCLAAARGQKLSGLKTWCSIGTPFLSFGPAPVSTWLWSAIVASIALPVLACWQLVRMVDNFPKQLTELLWWQAGLLGLAVLVLLAFLLAGIGGIALFLRVRSNHARTQRAEKLAAEEYGRLWRGYWHPNDEVIGGLRTSLFSPATVTPSLWGSQFFGQASNEFIWQRLAFAVQGSDVAGLQVQRVSECPRAIANSGNLLSPALQQRMSAAADSAAAAGAGRLRALIPGLSVAGSGDRVVDELRKVLHWDEILHTSYFGDELAAAIAGHISSSGSAPGSKNVISGMARTDVFRPRAMPVLLASGIILTVGASCFAAFAAIDAYLWPLADSFQEQAIVHSLVAPRYHVQGMDSSLGTLLVSGLTLGHREAALAAIARIKNPTQQSQIAQILAFHLGYRGRFDLLPDLIKSAGGHEYTAARINGRAIVGATLSKAKAPTSLVRDTYQFVFSKLTGDSTKDALQVALISFEALREEVEAITRSKPPGALADVAEETPRCPHLREIAAYAASIAADRVQFERALGGKEVAAKCIEGSPDWLRYATQEAVQMKSHSVARELLADRRLWITQSADAQDHPQLVLALDDIVLLLDGGELSEAILLAEGLGPTIEQVIATPPDQAPANARYTNIVLGLVEVAAALKRVGKPELVDRIVHLAARVGLAHYVSDSPWRLADVADHIALVGGHGSVEPIASMLAKEASRTARPSVGLLAAAAQVALATKDNVLAKQLRASAWERVTTDLAAAQRSPWAMVSLYKAGAGENKAKARRALDIAQAGFESIAYHYERNLFLAALARAWLEAGDLRRAREVAALATSDQLVLASWGELLVQRLKSKRLTQESFSQLSLLGSVAGY